MALQKTLTDSILPRPPLSGSVGSFTATEGCLCATGFISSFLKRLRISLSTFYSQITYPPSFTILGRFGIILDPAAPACVCSFWTQTSQLIFYDNVQLKKKKQVTSLLFLTPHSHTCQCSFWQSIFIPSDISFFLTYSPHSAFQNQTSKWLTSVPQHPLLFLRILLLIILMYI